MGQEVTMRSQTTTCGYRSVAQYNGNNSWLYNGNNGCLNNNNKYNSYQGRSLDYRLKDYGGLQDFLKFNNRMDQAWRICRKTKRGSSAQLQFEYDTEQRVTLSLVVWLMEYMPMESIAFIICVPKLREVIAAYFGDRVVQTLYNENLKPYLESDWYDQDSYSCRQGKGGLRAIQELQKKIEIASCGYVLDVTLVKKDFDAFFMSIDTEVLERILTEFIMQKFGTDEEERNKMLWLTRIIYRSTPQNHVVKKSHGLAWHQMEDRKIMIGKLLGLCIGNVTSQTGANVINTLYLVLLRAKGYLFVHYTDDTVIIVLDWEKWKRDEKEIDEFISSVLHLKWHRKKIYVQHISKGIEFLGAKIRFDRILPSDRIAHNFIWKTKCAIEKAENNSKDRNRMKEEFMESFNSYCGLLKWYNSNRLRNHAFELLKNSKLAKVYDFHGNNKITIKKEQTIKAYYLAENRRWKRNHKKSNQKTIENYEKISNQKT